MRKYHDKEGLAKIGMSAEKFNQSQAGIYILIEFTKEYDIYPVQAMVRQVIDKKNLNAVQPDVCFYEEDNPVAVVVIEIEDHENFSKCKKTVKQHLTEYPDIKEGFAFNIDKKEWVRYAREGKKITEYEGESYSEYLDADFETYLENYDI
ncbi:MAG: hypothetical protein RML94_02665 [Bacteroidia bacterium]|nr:hypothetical protein [Bacteroidia bacterium]